MMAIGFVIAWHFYIRRPDIPVELARQHDVLYNFLLNKWYFDEIYDVAASCGRPSGSAACCGRAATAG